jgi:hypothetical protein
VKRFLFLLGIAVACTVVLCGLTGAYLFVTGNQSFGAAAPAATAPSTKLRPLPDVVALAARLPHDQDVYQGLSQAALAAYAKNHPGSHPYDAEARDTLKLASYLLVWDDFYGEGLWRNLNAHAEHLENEGCHDQVWLSLENIVWGPDEHSSSDEAIGEVNACENRLGASEYPAAFKLAAYQMALGNVIKAQANNAIKQPATLATLPDLAAKAAACYGQLIAQHLPHDYLFRKGSALIDEAQDDEPTLIAVSKAIDKAFATEDPTNLQAQVLDGQFYVNNAWNARGSDVAGTVSSEGWRLFAERLARADSILSTLYSQAPQEPGTPSTMMTVTLGEQLPRDQMELWFQRGRQVDPDNFALYMQKRWYLLPRWYGSDEDVWSFGMECAQSSNWQAKIPLILVEGIRDRAENDPQVYAQPEIWNPVEKVYRTFLDHYPNSIHYRSLFALAAAQGGHWDVAKEQFKILDDDWDAEIFPDTLYADTLRQVQAH